MLPLIASVSPSARTVLRPLPFVLGPTIAEVSCSESGQPPLGRRKAYVTTSPCHGPTVNVTVAPSVESATSPWTAPPPGRVSSVGAPVPS